jgi:hypothetical protein
MKQTKPFGRAYIPATEAAAARNTETQVSQPPVAQEDGGATSTGSADLFSLSGGALPMDSPEVARPWQQKIREWCSLAATVIALLTVYVLLRDSMALANLLQQVTTEETVMICKDGKMVYPDYSILDRLMNNGCFLCTEWSVQRGFLTLPRH